MSSLSEGSEAVSSCITASSSDASAHRGQDSLPAKSSSLLSGYDPDLDSSSQAQEFVLSSGSEHTTPVPVQAADVAPNQIDNMGKGDGKHSNQLHEQIGDSDQGNRINVQLFLEGDNSCSAPALPKLVEDSEEEAVANLRRKRSEAEGPSEKKPRLKEI